MSGKQLPYVILASLLFLVMHIAVLFLRLDDGVNFMMILSAMVLTQLLVFSIVRRKSGDELRSFSSIFVLLSLTQFFSVTLLTVYSAFDPLGEPKAIHFIDVLTSIVLFVLVLPLIVASMLWFTIVKKSVNKAP